MCTSYDLNHFKVTMHVYESVSVHLSVHAYLLAYSVRLLTCLLVCVRAVSYLGTV